MVIGRIYKIISGQGNECYVGSTFDELNYRFRGHKRKYQLWKKKLINNKTTSFQLFEKYGMNNCKCILIKEYDVIDRKHLEAYETLWICKLKKNVVNKQFPFCIMKLSQKLQHKLYYEKNKEKLKNKSRKRYEENKNEENMKKKEKINCECGSVVRRSDKARHIKSKKHQNWLNNQKTE